MDWQSHIATDISICYLEYDRTVKMSSKMFRELNILTLCEMFHAWVVWIKDVSVTIFSPRRTDSTHSKWMSMELIGTADASIVSTPLIGSNKEQCVDILPVTLKPPFQQQISSVPVTRITHHNIHQILKLNTKHVEVNCN